MSFIEYLKSINFHSCADYARYVNQICDNLNIDIKSISMNNIDDLIDTVKNDASYIRRTGHGNSYVSALKKYKEYLMAQNNPLPQMGKDSNGYHVQYAKDVDDDEKIPGLCRHLECEYERIMGFAHRLFGKKVELDRIPVILSKEMPYDKIRITAVDKINMIKLKNKYFGMPSAIEMMTIINTDSMMCPVLGMYFGQGANGEKEPYIVLYYKNIGTVDKDLYFAMIAQTLAHEYMHYVHNMISGANFYRKCKYRNDVTEAVADFFSVLFSVWSHRTDRKIDAARERYFSWVKYVGSDWKYANALWFLFNGYRFLDFDDKYEYYEKNGSVEKLIGVVDVSKNDMDQAYTDLTH